jgi:NAD-dependent deacetylase
VDGELERLLEDVGSRQGRVVALTGAGISAESGIPTFRSGDGYWVIGSRNYVPEEIATRAMFDRAPDEVWRWYLARFAGVAVAQPNAAHRALVTLERALGDRFTLVTQNIDGLHHKAGASRERTFCIHGEAALVRCSDGCTKKLRELPLPARTDPLVPLDSSERERLRCKGCGAWLRPHVLLFDEYYDEAFYRMDSALAAADAADLLLVVGTTGATTLPMRIGQMVAANGGLIVDVDPEPNMFSSLAERRGAFVQGPATAHVPGIVAVLTR